MSIPTKTHSCWTLDEESQFYRWIFISCRQSHSLRRCYGPCTFISWRVLTVQERKICFYLKAKVDKRPFQKGNLLKFAHNFGCSDHNPFDVRQEKITYFLRRSPNSCDNPIERERETFRRGICDWHCAVYNASISSSFSLFLTCTPPLKQKNNLTRLKTRDTL